MQTLSRTKHTGIFSDVPESTQFSTRRHPDGCDADSLTFTKKTTSKSNAHNSEFGEQTLDGQQPCWWYTD
jgi:hypothetical protein